MWFTLALRNENWLRHMLTFQWHDNAELHSMPTSYFFPGLYKITICHHTQQLLVKINQMLWSIWDIEISTYSIYFVIIKCRAISSYNTLTITQRQFCKPDNRLREIYFCHQDASCHHSILSFKVLDNYIIILWLAKSLLDNWQVSFIWPTEFTQWMFWKRRLLSFAVFYIVSWTASIRFHRKGNSV